MICFTAQIFKRIDHLAERFIEIFRIVFIHFFVILPGRHVSVPCIREIRQVRKPSVSEIENGVFSQGERRSGIERVNSVVRCTGTVAESYMFFVKSAISVCDLLVEVIIRRIKHE